MVSMRQHEAKVESSVNNLRCSAEKSANSDYAKRFIRIPGAGMPFATPAFLTDNAAMIAMLGALKLSGNDAIASHAVTGSI